MSELAFDAAGEPIDLPAMAAMWKVRRFRNAGGRGGPELVFGRDGLPLIIPIDTGISEFRELVSEVPGRYRLDPTDEGKRVVPDLPAAYVTLSETTRIGSGDIHADLIRDLVRANVEVVKSMTTTHAAVLQATAEILRAADGAGMPRRAPAETRNAAAAELTDGDDEPRSELVEIIKQVMPLVQLAVSSLLNRKAASSAPKVLEPPRNGAAAPAQASEEPATETKQGDPAPAETEVVSHIQAIESHLTPEEVGLARGAIAAMPPDVVQEWLKWLCELTPEAAAGKVRAEIERVQGGGS